MNIFVKDIGILNFYKFFLFEILLNLFLTKC